MNEDLVREFLLENYENLDRFDRDLIELEEDPGNVGILGSVFRAMHTIKGTCGFVAFGKLEALAHVGESLLARMRDGELLLNAEIATALLASSDAIREMLGSIETTGAEGDQDCSAVVATLKRLTAAAAQPEAFTGKRTPAAAAATGVPAARGSVVGSAAGNAARRGATLVDSSVRVDVSLLDKVIDLVAELVLTRNEIVHSSAMGNAGAFSGAIQRLNLVTSELEESVVKTRRQSIDAVWSRLPRLVRDLAAQCGKRVRLEMEGNDIDLDRTIVAAIKDPLTHIVRNAVDHGIELPQARAARGKPPEGVIRLRGFHQDGHLSIEISDDGAGVDPARIKAAAEQRGLVTAEQAAFISEHDMLRFVFLPGFSTAASVSTISGRGIGLDIVRANVERVKGTVDIQSRVGVGTTITMRIPSARAATLSLIAGDSEPVQSSRSIRLH